MTAFREMNEKGIIGNEDVAYLYFSDGAPTAGRFLFQNTLVDLEENNPDGFGTHDYTHYSVEWIDGGLNWPGPSLLTRSGSLTRDYASASAPPPGTAGIHVPTCSPAYDNPPSSSAEFNGVFDNCITNMGFHLPFAPGTTFGDDIDAVGVRQYETNWREQYFHCSIKMADFLRNNRGVLYTVGLGPELDMATAIANGDPYQDLNDSWFRKDLFLTRTANDYFEAVPISTALYGGAHPELSFQGYETYATLEQATPQNFGRYYASPSADELDDLFISAGQAILLRLIE
jgi:hypothetical protein